MINFLILLLCLIDWLILRSYLYRFLLLLWFGHWCLCLFQHKWFTMNRHWAFIFIYVYLSLLLFLFLLILFPYSLIWIFFRYFKNIFLFLSNLDGILFCDIKAWLKLCVWIWSWYFWHTACWLIFFHLRFIFTFIVSTYFW